MRALTLTRIGFAGLLVASGCGGGDSSGPSGVFQLAEVATNTLTVQCGTNPISHITSASPDELQFNIHVVNTTNEDVTITSVGSVGTVIHASNDVVVGQSATTFTSLNFQPQPLLVRAHDGDVTLIVRLPMASSCVQGTPVLEFKDTSTSLRVFTSAGLFVTLPMTLHLNFVGGS